MIKLKIGDNYLITTNHDDSMKDFIIYCMGCFKGHNKIILGFDMSHTDFELSDYVKAVKEENPRELFILIDTKLRYHNNISPAEWVMYMRDRLGLLQNKLKNACPNLSPRIIRIDKDKEKREYKVAGSIYDALRADERNILHHLDKLDEYKMFANRYKAIPNEIKVISENIKQMSKERKVCDRVITLDTIKYLDMIESAELEGDSLFITIKPLPIYTSEKMGMYITKGSFANNKYLARAAEYIYKGGHFGMVGTRVLIHPDFRPEFVETVDHTFDDMFKRSNWSSVGYLHFGKDHLCGGEFNDVIAHTAEHGLEYYFNCFKQYITTANIRDYAGAKVWWYPIYDDNNNLIYCAGLDILRDWCMDRVPRDEREKLLAMNWNEFIAWKQKHNIKFNQMETPYHSNNFQYHSGAEDQFLAWCKEQNPKLYEELEKGAD